MKCTHLLGGVTAFGLAACSSSQPSPTDDVPAADTTATAVPVTAGSATVNLAVPSSAAAGPGTLVLTAAESGTRVTVGVKVAAADPAGPVCTAPVKPARPADLAGQLNYGQAMAAYRACLRG